MPHAIKTGLRPMRSLHMPSGICSSKPPAPNATSNNEIQCWPSSIRKPYRGKLLFMEASISPYKKPGMSTNQAMRYVFENRFSVATPLAPVSGSSFFMRRTSKSTVKKKRLVTRKGTALPSGNKLMPKGPMLKPRP